MEETPWRTLNQVAAVPTLFPDTLLSHLAEGAHVLELGCGRGDVCRFLRERGMVVTGIDLNDRVIAAASISADEKGESVTFIAADIRRDPAILSGRTFDAVLMIRFLTCFPNADDRRRLLAIARGAINPNGVLYVRDFLLSDGYHARYDDAVSKGMSYGDFPVMHLDGTVRYVAHHHTEHEARTMLGGYEPLLFRVHDSLSMNGNPCTMFEMIGRSSVV